MSMAKDRKPVNVRVEDSAEHFTTITVNRLNGTIPAVPCDTTLHYTTLHGTVLYGTLYCTVLYCTVLYFSVLYCALPHYTVLYCTVPCDTTQKLHQDWGKSQVYVTNNYEAQFH